MVGRLKKELGREVPLTSVFEAPTGGSADSARYTLKTDDFGADAGGKVLAAGNR